MNKQDLKSLLENIYTALTEADIPDNPPAPEGYNPLPQEPWPWPPNPLSTTPPPPPPKPEPDAPPIQIKPQPGDDPALIEEINNILNILRFLLNLSGEHQDDVEALRARLRDLIRELWRQRNLGQPQPDDGGTLG